MLIGTKAFMSDLITDTVNTNRSKNGYKKTGSLAFMSDLNTDTVNTNRSKNGYKKTGSLAFMSDLNTDTVNTNRSKNRYKKTGSLAFMSDLNTDTVNTNRSKNGYKKTGSLAFMSDLNTDTDDTNRNENVHNEPQTNETDVDNRKLDFSEESHPICIQLDSNGKSYGKKPLQICNEDLCKKYKKLLNIMPKEERLKKIIGGVFPDGFQKEVYIRNLTFSKQESNEKKFVGIRPVRTEGDYLSNYIPDNESLLFIGHLSGKVFYVDSIHEAIDDEQLDFEVKCRIISYEDMSMIHNNILYDIVEEASSLSDHLLYKLKSWKDYLNWREELVKKKINGCKYYKLTLNEEENRLVFWLVCESKEYFYKFKKNLYNDIQVFDNDYSENKWKFEFPENIDSRKYRFNSIELGRFKGVVKEYYLKDYVEEVQEDISDAQEAILEYEYEEEYEKVDKADDAEITTESIFEVFENPYIVQVAFEINAKDEDEINEKGLEDSEITDYIKENVLPNYYNNGFLARSAIGEFVLLNRLNFAIYQLESGTSYSPNLALWLFDIEKARLLKEQQPTKIEKWLNPEIEKNQSQREAVIKMLQAPDICLIQGPPGTGKTTVIAEAIYQFIGKGQRVLLASQSNDAVDNALERLGNTPEIRAIRFGLSKKKKYNKDQVISKFSEEDALKYYYKSLADEMDKKWINPWNDIKRKEESYKKDISELTFLEDDIRNLNKAFEEENNNCDKLSLEKKKITDEIKRINKENSNIQRARNDFRLYKEFIENVKNNTNELYKGNLSFPQEINEIFEKHINSLVERNDKKIYILKDKFYSSNTELDNLFKLEDMIRNYAILKNFTKKLDTLNIKNADDNNELQKLKRNKQLVEKSIIENLNNPEKLEELKEELNEIKLYIDKRESDSSSLSINSDEKKLISDELIQGIYNGEKETILKEIEKELSLWENIIKNIIKEVDNYLSSYESISTKDMESKLKSLNGLLKYSEKNINDIDIKLKDKGDLKSNIIKKYNLNTQENLTTDDVIKHLEDLKQENQARIDKDRETKRVWEKIINEYKNKLEDDKAYIYDKIYYGDVYNKSCNVIGISCTENTKNLSDKGYEYFDVAIIDEVSKATPPELLIPLMRGKKAILVGDHRQLPPMFKEHEKSYMELIGNEEEIEEENNSEEIEEISEESMNLLTRENFKKYKNMVTSSLFKEYFEKADESIKHSLITQYRMHSDIMDIINRFYNNQLKNGFDEETENRIKNHELTIKSVDGSSFIKPEDHAYWIDSSNLDFNTPIYESFLGRSTSACNILEKYLIIELLKKMAKKYAELGYGPKNRKSVGVISFYQSQVNQLREIFKKTKKTFDFSSLYVDINTVDRFQGKEKNIIITSLVRNNKKRRGSKHIAAFERINVAFSRAQELLIIVGSEKMYNNCIVDLPNMDTQGINRVKIYKNITDHLKRKGCFNYSNCLLTDEVKKKVLYEYKKVNEDK